LKIAAKKQKRNLTLPSLLYFLESIVELVPFQKPLCFYTCFSFRNI